MLNKENLIKDIEAIRTNSPLVHNITNYVVMNNTANALLSLGASPVMAHAIEEVADMVSFAGALVINIGTLSEKWIDAMRIAMKAAKSKNIPIVFDPVGAGATNYRTSTCLSLLEDNHPTIIRGNASEIMALVNAGQKTKGVDSTNTTDDALESAKLLAQRFDCVVSISGEIDYITDGETVNIVKNGTSLLTKVTGMGCTATAITGAFASVNKNYLEAATNAMALMGIAGEVAEKSSNGPGSLQINFLDTLYNIGDKEIGELLKI